MHACKGADLQPAPFDGWQRAFSGTETFSADYCSQGGFWLLFMRANSPHKPGDHNEAIFSAPPNTTIYGYSLWRSAQIMGSSGYAYTLAHGDRSHVVDSCYSRLGCTSRGTPNDPGAQSNVFWQLGLRGVRNLWLGVSCQGPSNCSALTTDSPAKLWIHRADIYLEDDVPPSFTALTDGPAVRGPLVDSPGPVMGVQSVTISATDLGGGVGEATAELDGQEVGRGILDSNGGSCTFERPFTKIVPCKTSVTGALAIDTSRVPDGEHTLRIRVADVTRANLAEWPPLKIRTANGCRLDPRAASRRIDAAFVTRRGRRIRHRRAVTVAHGHGATLEGTVRTAGGSPIANAQVCIVARPDVAGAPATPEAWLPTDATGRFSYRVPPGPSRRFYAVHAAPDGAAVASVELRVRPAVSLRRPRRALRNGDVLALRGRVRGGPIPPRGVLVEVQAWRRTHWQTFGTTRARGRGRFTFRYRFSRTTGVQRYRLRARVPDQSGYPYAPGTSRAVAVRVRA